MSTQTETLIVVNLESELPERLGEFVRIDEDVVVYRTSNLGLVRNAPIDCVAIVNEYDAATAYIAALIREVAGEHGKNPHTVVDYVKAEITVSRLYPARTFEERQAAAAKRERR